MHSRRIFLQTSAAAAAYLASGVWTARAENAPGVTDTEIKLGQTMPYSGAASAYGVIGRAEASYFKAINDAGGINGRKINLISLDDGYSPPKTVEQTRYLIEHERVAFIFGSLGTPTNQAIRAYLNDNKVPQLFISTGSSLFGDPKHFPWTMGNIASYQTEARIFAKHILTTKPDAKIGVLYQNDGYGMDYLTGLHAGLGSDQAGMIVKEVSYEVSEPTVDLQVATLQGAGVGHARCYSPRPREPPRRQSARLTTSAGRRVRYLSYPASSIAATLKPAGLDKSKGADHRRLSRKDPDRPRAGRTTPGYRAMGGRSWRSLMTPADLVDAAAVTAWARQPGCWFRS